jgi:hypothetical protein
MKKLNSFILKNQDFMNNSEIDCNNIPECLEAIEIFINKILQDNTDLVNHLNKLINNKNETLEKEVAQLERNCNKYKYALFDKNRLYDIFSKKYIGIPIYVSSKKNHLSIEHTHPPHDYILGKDKFATVGRLKKEINEIIK